ncbi:restriction endonuclease subunit S [Alteromonas macleodii]|uniref:restriction endonuclease subunit S n=1 Tax=Alteromonas macleodii TaxID=28108 RepID=UPI00313C2DA9
MVPNGWKAITLGDLVTDSAFGPRFSSDLYSENGAIGTIRTTDLCDEGTINYNTIPYANLGIDEFKSHILDSGDLLITRSGTCGIPCIFEKQDKPIIAGAFLIRFKLKSDVDASYLHYLLKYDVTQHHISKMASGGVQKNLTGTSLKKLKLEVPEHKEQRKIAKILSTWDKAITTTERLIDNSKQQKKALMQQLLTGKKRLLDDSGKPFKGVWEEVTVDQLCQVGRGRVISKKEINENQGQYPVYSSQTMNNGVMGSIGTYDFDGEYATWTTDGANAGTVFYRKGKFNCTNVCGTLKPKDLGVLNTQFLALSLSLVTYKYVSHTLANPKLMNGVMKSVAFSIPCIQEQEKIASVLTNADKEIELLEQQLADLKQEKKALMQQLLTGKRRVKVDDEAAA